MTAQQSVSVLNVVPRTEQEETRIADVTAHARQFDAPEKFEALPAGKATVRYQKNANAFSSPSGNMDFDGELDFKLGNALFRKLWVSSPSSTLASDGLGPIYNARSCQRCHLKDGRGHPPNGPDDSRVSLLMALGMPVGENPWKEEVSDYLATEPDPVYGRQFQDHSTTTVKAEGRFDVSYSEQQITLADGIVVSLRRPTYTLNDLAYGELDPRTIVAPRIAPQMIGLGLLEAIAAEDIIALADPDDADGDGVSGRANMAIDRASGQAVLGRFGLKAGKPSVKEQVAAAFFNDIGISTTLNPAGYGDCTESQTKCRSAPDGNTPLHDDAEISDDGLEFVVFYSRNLGVPERRNPGATDVLRGKEVFYNIGCVSCHRPKFVTERLVDQPEQSFQLIWPYTDMLLHDMGEGLADGLPAGRATGSEWRTPPLWGIGLTEQVSGHTNFLHDGRARNLLEAILWHGGEGEASKNKVIELSTADREALLAFVESL